MTKVYPEVREGQFRTDLHFVSGRPENIRAGQTYHLNLQLGDPVPAVIVPRGSFYQASGGEYMYVVDEEGKTARRALSVSAVRTRSITRLWKGCNRERR